MGPEDADEHFQWQPVGEVVLADSIEGPDGRGQFAPLDVLSVGPLGADTDPPRARLPLTVEEPERATERLAGLEEAEWGSDAVGRRSARGHRLNVVAMPLDVIGAPLAVGRQLESVTVAAVEARPPFVPGQGAVFGADLDDILGCQFVAMLHASHDESPAHRRHHRQKRRPDQGEPEHPPEDHLPSAHRLGRDRLDSLRLEVGREAEDGEDQGHHADEEVRRAEDESEIELAGVDARRIEEPAAEEHDDREHREDHENIPPHRFLDREPSERPNPPPGHPGEVLDPGDDPPVDAVTGLQWPVHGRLDEPGGRRGDHCEETRREQVPEKRRPDPLPEFRNRLFQNHVPLPRCVSPPTGTVHHEQPAENRLNKSRSQRRPTVQPADHSCP